MESVDLVVRLWLGIRVAWALRHPSVAVDGTDAGGVMDRQKEGDEEDQFGGRDFVRSSSGFERCIFGGRLICVAIVRASDYLDNHDRFLLRERIIIVAGNRRNHSISQSSTDQAVLYMDPDHP